MANEAPIYDSGIPLYNLVSFLFLFNEIFKVLSSIVKNKVVFLIIKILIVLKFFFLPTKPQFTVAVYLCMILLPFLFLFGLATVTLYTITANSAVSCGGLCHPAAGSIQYNGGPFFT